MPCVQAGRQANTHVAGRTYACASRAPAPRRDTRTHARGRHVAKSMSCHAAAYFACEPRHVHALTAASAPSEWEVPSSRLHVLHAYLRLIACSGRGEHHPHLCRGSLPHLRVTVCLCHQAVDARAWPCRPRAAVSVGHAQACAWPSLSCWCLGSSGPCCVRLTGKAISWSPRNTVVLMVGPVAVC